MTDSASDFLVIQVSQASFSGVDGGVGGGVVDVGEDGAVGSSVSSGCPVSVRATEGKSGQVR